ncbi:MAG: CDP-alcohol phosphatidyltransferase family protein [Bacteroidota bacterium]
MTTKNRKTNNNPSVKTSASWISTIPNAVTLLNLLSGMTATILVFQGQFAFSLLFFGLSLISDFADGLLARMLNATTELGKQLDSLSDLVSFGVYPAASMFYILNLLLSPQNTDSVLILPFIAIIIPGFGALRLAIFNLEDQNKNYFQGLPIPAAAFGILSAGFMVKSLISSSAAHTAFTQFFTSSLTITAAIVLYSILMISKLPMLNLKFSGTKWKENQHRYLLVALLTGAMIWFKLYALPFLIPGYIIYSLVFSKKTMQH